LAGTEFNGHAKGFFLHSDATMIDARAAEKIQPHLLSGENIYWAGMPDPKVIFHSDDWTAIPFSLLWAGFAVFWEANVLGMWHGTKSAEPPSTFMVFWGIPFLIVGNYFVWGRFFFDAWIKRRTYYAVTNRRVFILQEGWSTKTIAAFLDSIPNIVREGDASGTLWFGPKYPIMGTRGAKKRNVSRFWLDDVPVFADIRDLDTVCRLVNDLREKAAPYLSSVAPLSYKG
jgi:hypothetical protein